MRPGVLSPRRYPYRQWASELELQDPQNKRDQLLTFSCSIGWDSDPSKVVEPTSWIHLLKGSSGQTWGPLSSEHICWETGWPSQNPWKGGCWGSPPGQAGSTPPLLSTGLTGLGLSSSRGLGAPQTCWLTAAGGKRGQSCCCPWRGQLWIWTIWFWCFQSAKKKKNTKSFFVRAWKGLFLSSLAPFLEISERIIEGKHTE